MKKITIIISIISFPFFSFGQVINDSLERFAERTLQSYKSDINIDTFGIFPSKEQAQNAILENAYQHYYILLPPKNVQLEIDLDSLLIEEYLLYSIIDKQTNKAMTLIEIGKTSQGRWEEHGFWDQLNALSIQNAIASLRKLPSGKDANLSVVSTMPGQRLFLAYKNPSNKLMLYCVTSWPEYEHKGIKPGVLLPAEQVIEKIRLENPVKADGLHSVM